MHMERFIILIKIHSTLKCIQVIQSYHIVRRCAQIKLFEQTWKHPAEAYSEAWYWAWLPLCSLLTKSCKQLASLEKNILQPILSPLSLKILRQYL